MAVHDLKATDLTVVRGWQTMETFPRDGHWVEAQEHERDEVYRVMWDGYGYRAAHGSGYRPVSPTRWREPE
jgi:hypothetical protein